MKERFAVCGFRVGERPIEIKYVASKVHKSGAGARGPGSEHAET
jgi:hypothetical protein